MLGSLVRGRMGTEVRDLRLAGEAVVLRDERGTHFAVPLEVLATSSSELTALAEAAVSTSTSSFVSDSVRLGPLQFVGVTDRALAFRDRAGRRLAISPGALEAARVPLEGAGELEAQLPRVERPAVVDVEPFGRLHLLGCFPISYVPDEQDAVGPSTPSGVNGEHAPTTAADAEVAEARRALFRAGWCTLSDAAFPRPMRLLAAEARDLVRPASHEYEITSQDKLAIRVKRYAVSGPVLSGMHCDPAVVAALTAVRGTFVVPTNASYYFYSGDDYVSLHRDNSHCPLAMLVRVYGDPPPLMIYPGLRGCSAETVRALADASEQHPVEAMRFLADGAVIFEAGELPHYRAPVATGNEFVGVAQLCYRYLWIRPKPPPKLLASRPAARLSPTSVLAPCRRS
jgi:hypothetical protein